MTASSESSPQRANRLQHETSPYLQQHAFNPVDWYPWGDEALQAARAQQRPIFLSIGYSACHWCHVMERESFENDQIAEQMNRCFINIKVDREERPDLDQIYMNAVMALTGSGGWPMSVFLTPELQPFFGGTYWPPVSRWGRPGFLDVVQGVHDAWQNRREAVTTRAAELTEQVVQASSLAVPISALGVSTLEQAQRSLLRAADREHGGFGSAPKFPHATDIRVLLRCAHRLGSAEALQVATLTLDKMARGGIYDHLGGGFARYSTDERWLVPHFEKMLYDNALLVPAYLEAAQLTGRGDFVDVVTETLDYVLREMTQPGGGFYSTQDADSEGVEGKYFVWTPDEVDAALGHEDAEVFCRAYDVTAAGNWEHRSILNRPRSLTDVAHELGRDEGEVAAILRTSRSTLFAVRQQRVAPARDDKVLTNWNGLMISAMAMAGRQLGQPRYVTAAVAAASFVRSQLQQASSGRLWHAFKDGQARFNGYLDDYAAMIDALVELAIATSDPQWLSWGTQLAERMIEQFWDADDAGFFYTSNDHETLITRLKEIHDNATPSGNSLAAMGLIRLGRLTSRIDLEQRGRETLEMMSGTLSRLPMAAGQALLALDLVLGPSVEAILVADRHGQYPEGLWSQLQRSWGPNMLWWRSMGTPASWDAAGPVKSLLEGKLADDDVTLYVCQQGACGAPIRGMQAILSGEWRAASAKQHV
jgi:uncharacterized protein